MKIAPFGDLHYDAGIDADIEKSMDIIEGIMVRERVDLIVLTGDIYNGKSTVASRNIVKERMKSLSRIAPILMCYGNHDYPGDLDILADLKTDNPIKVYNTISTVQYRDCMIYMVPWIDKSRWLKFNAERDINEANHSVSSLLSEYLGGLRRKSAFQKNLLFGHILISGAKAENNQPLIGEGVTIGAFDFQDLGFDLAALGHIHLRQEFANGMTFYSGSPAAMDFGESFDKYLPIYDTDINATEWHKIDAVKRVTITGAFMEGVWAADSTQDLSGLAGSRLRVNYNISVTEDQALAKGVIGSYFSQYDLLELKLNPIIKHQTRTRAEAVSMSGNLPGKLIEFWKATDSEPDLNERDSILNKLKLAEESCKTGNLPFKG